jgi:putrescine transport system substrate-binding protein
VRLVPDEGSVLFIDSLVIPSSAKRPDLAHRFINYLMQPEVAALVTAETLYSQRQRGLREFRRNLRNQPDLYPAIAHQTLAVPAGNPAGKHSAVVDGYGRAAMAVDSAGLRARAQQPFNLL